jgi:hypothetical protein
METPCTRCVKVPQAATLDSRFICESSAKCGQLIPAGNTNRRGSIAIRIAKEANGEDPEARWVSGNGTTNFKAKFYLHIICT